MIDRLKTSIDLLDDIIAQKTLSLTSIRLLIDKIIVHQTEDMELDIHFKMKGPYQTHIALWNQFDAMDRNGKKDKKAEAMLEVVKSLQENTF